VLFRSLDGILNDVGFVFVEDEDIGHKVSKVFVCGFRAGYHGTYRYGLLVEKQVLDGRRFTRTFLADETNVVVVSDHVEIKLFQLQLHRVVL
jgi:hypothetical protein